MKLVYFLNYAHFEKKNTYFWLWVLIDKIEKAQWRKRPRGPHFFVEKWEKKRAVGPRKACSPAKHWFGCLFKLWAGAALLLFYGQKNKVVQAPILAWIRRERERERDVIKWMIVGRTNNTATAYGLVKGFVEGGIDNQRRQLLDQSFIFLLVLEAWRTPCIVALQVVGLGPRPLVLSSIFWLESMCVWLWECGWMMHPSIPPSRASYI